MAQEEETITLNIKIPQKWNEELQRIAKQEFCSKSDIIRQDIKSRIQKTCTSEHQHNTR